MYLKTKNDILIRGEKHAVSPNTKRERERMTHSIIYTFMDEFIQTHDHGIFLLPMPTGVGKTYNAVDLMTDLVIGYAEHPDSEKPKFLFTTNLKKNLNHEACKEMFQKKGHPELYEEEVVVLKNALENICTEFPKHKDECPKTMKMTESYQALEKILQNYSQLPPQIDPTVRNEYDSHILRMELQFRNEIKKYLKDKVNNKKVWDVLKNPDKYPDYSWVFNLYPSARIFSSSILFMSVDKCLLPVDPIFKSSFTMYDADNQFSKGRIVFLDEIDASKDVMINRLVDEECEKKINYIELFTKLHDSLGKKSFPTSMLEKAEGESYATELDSIYDTFHEIYHKYHLANANIRLNEDLRDKKKKFLFHDGTYFTTLNRVEGMPMNYALEYDEKEKCNFITVQPKEQIDNEIGNMISEIRKVIKSLLYVLSKIAGSFMEKENKRREGSIHELEYEAAIRSVIREFLYLDSVDEDFLVTNAQQYYRTKLDKKQRLLDGSFYENGFQLYEFVDEDSHHFRTDIVMYQISRTPERIMAEIGMRYRLIGMSATAEMDTDIGNFVWDYIKKYLKDDMVYLTPEQRKQMQETYKSITAGYENIDLKAEYISPETEGSRLEDIPRWPMVSKAIDNVTTASEEAGSGKSMDYMRNRYYRFLKAYLNFMEQPDLRSFLYISPQLPKTSENATDLQRNVLQMGMDEIHRYTGQKALFYDLGGDSYAADKKTALEKLEAGRKVFIMSAYKTISAGQNMNYKVPDCIETIKTGEEDRNSETKDFDAIFLDAPTNALSRLPVSGNSKEFRKSILKRIIQLEYLKAKGEITAQDFTEQLKSLEYGKEKPISEKNKAHIRRYYEIQLLQALGRISRTNLKNKSVRIYVTDVIREYLKKGDLRKAHILYSPELEAVMELPTESPDSDTDKEFLEIANSRSNLFSAIIRNWIYSARSVRSDQTGLSGWRSDVMEEYQKCGRMSLEHLTPDEQQYKNDYQNYYIELPQESDGYYYRYSDDYREIEISMTKRENFNYRVSAEDSRVTQFLQWPGFREYMEGLGYQTEFGKSRYWPSPAAFNNIYKGRIGEVFGKFLFETVLHLELEEITDPELFELFDYKVAGSEIYVDFKNMHDSEKIPEEKAMMDWIKIKQAAAGNPSVIICNVPADSCHCWVHKSPDISCEIATVSSMVEDYQTARMSNTAVMTIMRLCHSYRKD